MLKDFADHAVTVYSVAYARGLCGGHSTFRSGEVAETRVYRLGERRRVDRV